MSYEELPKKLRMLRRLKRMNNDQFAEFLGVSKDTLKNWLQKRFNPSITNMENLVNMFELEGIL